MIPIMTDDKSIRKAMPQNEQKEDAPGENTGDTSRTQTGMVGTRDPRNVSDYAYEEAKKTAEGIEEEHEVRKDRKPEAKLENEGLDATGNEVVGKRFQPSVEGEQEASATTEDPESARDTLEEEHKMGLRPHDTSENKGEVDIASDRDEAEEKQRAR